MQQKAKTAEKLQILVMAHTVLNCMDFGPHKFLGEWLLDTTPWDTYAI